MSVGAFNSPEDPAQRPPDDLGVQDLLLDGRQDRLVRQVHREDEPSGTDGAPAQVMVAAQVGVGPTARRSSAVNDEAPAAEPALGKPGQEVTGLDPVGRTAPELPVRRPEV